MSRDFHSFNIQTSQELNRAGRCWAQWIFPTTTTSIPFGRQSIDPASCKITSLVISYLIQLPMKSMRILLFISVELHWALNKVPEFHLHKDCVFRYEIKCLLRGQILQIKTFSQLLLKSTGLKGGAKLEVQHPICTLPVAVAIQEPGLWQACASRYA